MAVFYACEQSLELQKISTPVFKSTRPLDRLWGQIRYLHYSLRTEEAYVYWVKKFIYFYLKRHPRDMPQALLAKIDRQH